MLKKELISIKADKVVDARGTVCPGPLLVAKKMMAKMETGEIVEIFSSDADTKLDVPNWANSNGHEYLGTIEEPGYFMIFLKKR